MTSRRFSLEPVLRYRALLADQAFAKLAELEASRGQTLRAIRDLGTRHAAEQAAMRSYQDQPQHDPLEVRRYTAALDAARFSIAQQQAVLAEVEQHILAQRAVLTQKRIDEEALAVLKKHHLERIRLREQRDEALAIDEAASIRTARNRSAA